MAQVGCTNITITISSTMCRDKTRSAVLEQNCRKTEGVYFNTSLKYWDSANKHLIVNLFVLSLLFRLFILIRTETNLIQQRK